MTRRARLSLPAFLILLAVSGCARTGLLSERYVPDEYRIPVRLESDALTHHPTFLVYGDNQAGWRVQHRFLGREHWLTWKQMLVPFYQVYLIGNGIAGGINWERQVPDYGAAPRRHVRQALYREVTSSEVDFLLSTGDIAAADGRRPLHWHRFIRENRDDVPLLDQVPFLPTSGNHDRTTDSTFGLPNFRSVFDREPFYVVDFPDGALIVVDTNVMIDWKDELTDAEQDRLFREWFVADDPDAPAWLERVLAARSGRPYLFISGHHPLIGFGNLAGQWYDPSHGRATDEKRVALLTLLKRHGVRAAFAGHEHYYEYNVLRYDDEGAPRCMHFLTVSGGGAPLRTPPTGARPDTLGARYASAGLDVKLASQSMRYHYGRVDVGRDSTLIRIVAVPERSGEPADVIDTIALPRTPDACNGTGRISQVPGATTMRELASCPHPQRNEAAPGCPSARPCYRIIKLRPG